MIAVLSQFRVANGMEAAVRAAFRERPHLVERAPGFIDLEVFVDEQDEGLFYLLTRWSDHESYRRWHGGADHRASHRFIPKGLKLDPRFTKVRELRKIAD